MSRPLSPAPDTVVTGGSTVLCVASMTVTVPSGTGPDTTPPFGTLLTYTRPALESTATAVGASPTGIVAVTLSVVPLMMETTVWFRSDTSAEWVAGSTAGSGGADLVA